MKKLLFAALVLTGLAGCGTAADYTSPDGIRVYGPKIQSSGDQLRHTLTYSVEGFKAQDDKRSADFLRGVAYSGVSDDDRSGTYDVIFTDQASSQIITDLSFSVESDLMGVRSIQLQQPPDWRR
jgi:opacity protein-like surface antigen